MSQILDEDFRKAGFTGAARKFPRNAMGLQMLAAFNNVRPDQMLPAWAFYPNAHTETVWLRVAESAAHYLASNENEAAELVRAHEARTMAAIRAEAYAEGFAAAEEKFKGETK